MIFELNEENYILFAAKHYYSLHYSMTEFNSDLKRVIYIKRLLRKYQRSGVLSERLILNHLILLFNVFEPPNVVNKMLFFKIDKECYGYLKTFLVYLNRMSNEIPINSDYIIISSDIKIDMHIAKLLREL